MLVSICKPQSHNLEEKLDLMGSAAGCCEQEHLQNFMKERIALTN
jgi:hypothetical protein